MRVPAALIENASLPAVTLKVGSPNRFASAGLSVKGAFRPRMHLGYRGVGMHGGLPRRRWRCRGGRAKTACHASGEVRISVPESVSWPVATSTVKWPVPRAPAKIPVLARPSTR